MQASAQPGSFCPKDRRQAELLVQLHRELEVSYCRLVTISTDVVGNQRISHRRRRTLDVPADADASFRRTSISPSTRMRAQSMIPHTIILEPGLVVFKIYNGYWFLARTTHQRRIATRPASRNHEMSPDWDITIADQKAAWARGEKTLPPYGRVTQRCLASRTKARQCSSC